MNSGTASRRLFFAIWPDAVEQQSIHAAFEPHIRATGGRSIPARNLHITLAFLGSVPSERIDTVNAIADRVGPIGKIDLAFERVELWRRSRVLVLLSRTVPCALRELVERLHFNLLNEQFEVGREEYRPHLTLARDARHSLTIELPRPIECSFVRFALVESKNSAAGSIYSNLHNWELIQ